MALAGRKHITQFVVPAFVLSYRIPCFYFCLTARKQIKSPVFVLSPRENKSVSEVSSQGFCCSAIMTVELKLNISSLLWHTNLQPVYNPKSAVGSRSNSHAWSLVLLGQTDSLSEKQMEIWRSKIILFPILYFIFQCSWECVDWVLGVFKSLKYVICYLVRHQRDSHKL